MEFFCLQCAYFLYSLLKRCILWTTVFSTRVFSKSAFKRVYLGVRTCELFLCFVAIVRVRAIMLTSLFYVTSEFHRFLH